MSNQIHGGDIYTATERTGLEAEDILDFSANINPLGLADSVRWAMIRSIDQVIHYPDPQCRILRSKIAGHEGVDPSFITCGNGAADLIFRLMHVLRPRRALLPVPTFLEYEAGMKEVGCEVSHYRLEEEKGFLLGEDFLHRMGPDLDMIVLCNPNNPTGLPIQKTYLENVLEKCRKWNIFLFIDECFIDFLDDREAYSMVSFCAESPQLFILKAFTKFYAMPGIRLGYGICASRGLNNALNGYGQPWHVSVTAQAAGIAALDDNSDYRRATRHLIKEERQYLKEALSQLGLKVYDSQANYIFFRQKKDQLLGEKMLNKGIMIRDCSNYPGLSPGYYRVAIKKHQDNEFLISALREVLM